MADRVFQRSSTPVAALTPPPTTWGGSAAPRRTPPLNTPPLNPQPSRTQPGSAIPLAEAALTAERAGLLSQLRDEIRSRHYSHRTEKAYAGWAGRFLCRLPRELRPRDADVSNVRQFLTDLALGNCSAATQNQAFSALLFLFRDVMRKDLAGLEDVVRAKRPEQVPQVLARGEVTIILGLLRGTPWLV